MSERAAGKGEPVSARAFRALLAEAKRAGVQSFTVTSDGAVSAAFTSPIEAAHAASLSAPGAARAGERGRKGALELLRSPEKHLQGAEPVRDESENVKPREPNAEDKLAEGSGFAADDLFHSS